LKKLINKLLSKPEDDAFVTMIQVALETPEMRKQLVSILSLPPQNREATIAQWLNDLKDQSAPQMLITALSYLEDNQRADKALELLRRSKQ
jgi:hypothetical protein